MASAAATAATTLSHPAAHAGWQQLVLQPLAAVQARSGAALAATGQHPLVLVLPGPLLPARALQARVLQGVCLTACWAPHRCSRGQSEAACRNRPNGNNSNSSSRLIPTLVMQMAAARHGYLQSTSSRRRALPPSKQASVAPPATHSSTSTSSSNTGNSRLTAAEDPPGCWNGSSLQQLQDGRTLAWACMVRSALVLGLLLLVLEGMGLRPGGGCCQTSCLWRCCCSSSATQGEPERHQQAQLLSRRGCCCSCSCARVACMPQRRLDLWSHVLHPHICMHAPTLTGTALLCIYTTRASSRTAAAEQQQQPPRAQQAGRQRAKADAGPQQQQQRGLPAS